MCLCGKQQTALIGSLCSDRKQLQVALRSEVRGHRSWESRAMTFDPAGVQVSYLMTAQVGGVRTEVTHRNRDNLTHTHLVSHLSVSDKTELFIHQAVA